MFSFFGKVLKIGPNVIYEAESDILQAREYDEGIVVSLDYSDPLTRQGNIRLVSFSGEVIWRSLPPNADRNLSRSDCYVGIIANRIGLVAVTAEGLEDELDIKTGKFIKLVGQYK